MRKKGMVLNMDKGLLEMKQLFFNNLQLLGFDVVAMEATNHIPFNKNMFELPNKRGAEIVLHFLFEKLNPTMCREAFRDIWPILDKKREQAFRKTCANWLGNIAQEEPDCHLPRINASLFMSPGGDKFYQLLLYFSAYVLQKILDTELAARASERLKYPALSSQNTELGDVMLKNLTCSSVRHRKSYFDVVQLTLKARKTWKETADEYVKDYRKLSKEIRELDYDSREEEQRALDNSIARGSPTKRYGKIDKLDPNFDPRTIQRAQRVQHVREMWKQLDDFERTEAAEREIIESIVERTINKHKIDAADISVKVPDMLLRECGEEIRRRNVSNTYQGGKLNLESVLQLWNLSLHLYLEKLKQIGMPKFDSDVKKLTSQVHVQQNYLQNARTLRGQMTERIPILKESIEKLRSQLDSAMFKDETPTSIRTTVSASVQTPSGTVVSCNSAGVRPSLSYTCVKPQYCSAGVQPLCNVSEKPQFHHACDVNIHVTKELRVKGNTCEKVDLSKGFERKLDKSVRDSLVSEVDNDRKVIRNFKNRQEFMSDGNDLTSASQNFNWSLDKCKKTVDKNKIKVGSKHSEYFKYQSQAQDVKSSMESDVNENFDSPSINTVNLTKQSKPLTDKKQDMCNFDEKSIVCLECGPFCVCGKTCIAMRNSVLEDKTQSIIMKHSELEDNGQTIGMRQSVVADNRQSITMRHGVLKDNDQIITMRHSELDCDGQINTSVDSQTSNKIEERSHTLNESNKLMEKHDHWDLKGFEEELKSVHLHPECTETSDDTTLSNLNGSTGFLVNLDDRNKTGIADKDREDLNISQLSASSGYQSKQSNTPQSVRTVSVLGIPDIGEVKDFENGLLSCEKNVLEKKQNAYMRRTEDGGPAVECYIDDDITLCDDAVENKIDPKCINEIVSTFEENSTDLRQNTYRPRMEDEHPAVECDNDDEIILCDDEIEVDRKYLAETMSTLEPDTAREKYFINQDGVYSMYQKSTKGCHDRENIVDKKKDYPASSGSRNMNVWPKFSPLKDMSVVNEHGTNQENDKTWIHEVSLSNQTILSKQKKCFKSFSVIKDISANTDGIFDTTVTPGKADVNHSITTYTELPGYDGNDEIITIGFVPESQVADYRKPCISPDIEGEVVVVKRTTSCQAKLSQSFKSDTSDQSSCTEKSAEKSQDQMTYSATTTTASVCDVRKDKQLSVARDKYKTRKLAMGHLVEPATVSDSTNLWERLRLKAEKRGKPDSDPSQKGYYGKDVHESSYAGSSNSNFRKQYDKSVTLASDSLKGSRSEASPRKVKKSLGLGLVEPSPQLNFSPGAAETPSQPIEVPRSPKYFDTPEAADRVTEEMRASVKCSPKQLFPAEVELLLQPGKKESAIPRPTPSKAPSQASSRQSSRPTSARSSTSARGSVKSSKSSVRSTKQQSSPRDRETVFPTVSSPKTMVAKFSQDVEKMDISADSIPLSARSDKSGTSSSTAKASQSPRSVKSHSSGRLSARSHDQEYEGARQQGRKTPTDLLVDEIMGEGKILSPFNSGLEAFESRNLVNRTPDLEDEDKENVKPSDDYYIQHDYNTNAVTEDFTDENNDKLQSDNVINSKYEDNDVIEHEAVNRHDEEREGMEAIDNLEHNYKDNEISGIKLVAGTANNNDDDAFEEIHGPELDDEPDDDDGDLSEGSNRSVENVIVIDRSFHVSPKPTPVSQHHSEATSYPLIEDKVPSMETSPRELIVIDHSIQRSPVSRVDRDQVRRDLLSKSFTLERSPLSEEIRQMFEKAVAETPQRPQSASRLHDPEVRLGTNAHRQINLTAPDIEGYDDKIGIDDELELPNMDINSRQTDPVPPGKTMFKADILWDLTEGLDDIEMPDFDVEKGFDEGTGNDSTEPNDDFNELDKDVGTEKKPEFQIPGVGDIEDIDEFFLSKTPELPTRHQGMFAKSLSNEDGNELISTDRSSFEIPKFPEATDEEEPQLITF